MLPLVPILNHMTWEQDRKQFVNLIVTAQQEKKERTTTILGKRHNSYIHVRRLTNNGVVDLFLIPLPCYRSHHRVMKHTSQVSECPASFTGIVEFPHV